MTSVLTAHQLSPALLRRFLTLAFIDLRDRGRECDDTVVWDFANVFHNLPSTFSLSGPNCHSVANLLAPWIDRNSVVLNHFESSRAALSRLTLLIDSQASHPQVRTALVELLECGLRRIRERGASLGDPVVIGICGALDELTPAFDCDGENDLTVFTERIATWLEYQSHFPKQLQWIEHQVSQAKHHVATSMDRPSTNDAQPSPPEK